MRRRSTTGGPRGSAGGRRLTPGGRLGAGPGVWGGRCKPGRCVQAGGAAPEALQELPPGAHASCARPPAARSPPTDSEWGLYSLLLMYASQLRDGGCTITPWPAAGGASAPAASSSTASVRAHAMAPGVAGRALQGGGGRWSGHRNPPWRATVGSAAAGPRRRRPPPGPYHNHHDLCPYPDLTRTSAG